jgi:low affinity Fe/Cu permease
MDRPRPARVFTMREWFRRFAHRTADVVGSPWAFLLAIVLVVAWALTGPMFHYSDTWQLIINTGTTILTFLMVFLIQNTQNRDAKAIHLKLDELLRGVEGARTKLVHLEELSDDELADLQEQFKQLHDRLARHTTEHEPRTRHEAGTSAPDAHRPHGAPQAHDPHRAA